MGIEPTAGGCPAAGFEVQERHQTANYSHYKKTCKIYLSFVIILVLACPGKYILNYFHKKKLTALISIFNATLSGFSNQDYL